MDAKDASQERLVRLPVVLARTGKSRAGIYRDIQTGSFPAPVKIGERCVAWRESDVERWIATRPSTSAGGAP